MDEVVSGFFAKFNDQIDFSLFTATEQDHTGEMVQGKDANFTEEVVESASFLVADYANCALDGIADNILSHKTHGEADVDEVVSEFFGKLKNEIDICA